MDGAYTMYGEIRNAHKSLVGKHEGKRAVENPICRLKNY
jgi:hypothetical protein